MLAAVHNVARQAANRQVHFSCEDDNQTDDEQWPANEDQHAPEIAHMTSRLKQAQGKPVSAERFLLVRIFRSFRFLFRYNHAARNAVACIAGRIGFHVVGLGVDHDGRPAVGKQRVGFAARAQHDGVIR